MRRMTMPAMITAALVLLSSCGGARPSKFYAIEMPSASAPAGAPAYPVALLIGRMTAPSVYRDTRIIYQTGPAEMGAYEYHRWVDVPADMLTNLLLRQLRASGRYETVQPLSSNASGDYVIRGQLYEFTEVNNGGSMTARVAFEMDVFEYASGKTVWSKHYSSSEPVSGTDISAVVAAFDRNVRRGLTEFSSGVDAYFASHPPKPKPTSTASKNP